MNPNDLKEYVNSGCNKHLFPSDITDCIAKINVDSREIHIHNHAISQYYQRLQEIGNITKPNRALKSLCALLEDSTEVKRKNAISQIIKYNFKPSEYRFSSGWIFVIEEGNIIKTVYLHGSISNSRLYKRV